jgi:hypothetical protein
MEGAYGLQRLPVILVPVLPLHAHGNEGSRIGVHMVLFVQDELACLQVLDG